MKIVGVIADFSSSERELIVRTMLAVFSDREAVSVYSDDRLDVTVGWRTDEGEGRGEGDNPGFLVSGEVFVSPSTACAGSAIERMYRRHGAGCLENVDGIFHGVLIDQQHGQIIMFNDRYGLERMYLYEGEGVFAFASEAKCLLKAFPQCRDWDERGVGELLSCGCVLQNRTFYRGVTLLPPASWWSFSKEASIRGTYFQSEAWETQDAMGLEDFVDRFHEVLSRRAPEYFSASRPIAMSLTGGIDGRMVMSGLTKKDRALACYTFGGPYRDCLDVRLARRVASACGATHQVLPLDRDFFDRFVILAEESIRVSDGAMDVTGAVEIYMNEHACKVAPVRMTGNYGSEIVRRNIAFRPRAYPEGLIEKSLRPSLDRAAVTYAAERQGHDLSFIAFKQIPWHHFARRAVEKARVVVRSPFLDQEIVKLMYRAPSGMVQSSIPSMAVVAKGDPELACIPTDRGITYPIKPTWTAARNRFENFMAKVEYAFDYGMPQRMATVIGPCAPLALQRKFLGRQKFYHFRTWYQKELNGMMREILLDSQTLELPWFCKNFIRRMVDQHSRGVRNYTSEIHKVMTFSLIKKLLL